MATPRKLRQCASFPAFAQGVAVVSPPSLRRTTLTAVAGVLLCSLALLGPPRDANSLPRFLHEALGPPQADAPLHHPADGVRVAVKSDRFSVVRGADSVSLAAEGTGNAEWSHFENGVTRRTPFGAETIVLDGDKAEQFLTVSERQGTRTWRWNLQAGQLTPRLGAEGAVGFLRGHRLADTWIAPVAIFDAQGKDVTPEGLGWELRREASAWSLELRLNDSALPLPYVVDPAITFRSSSSAATTIAGLTFTLNKPAGVVQDDLLLAHLTAAPSATTITAPAGWTQIRRDTATGSLVTQALYYRVAGAAEPASYTWNFSSAVNASGSILLYSGVDNPTPVDASSGATGIGGVPTAPSVDTTRADALVAAFFGYNATAPSFTPPAGMTTRSFVSGTASASASADMTQASPGPTGAKAVSSVAIETWAAQLLALKVDLTSPTSPVQAISESSADSFASGSTFYYRPNGGLGGATFTVSSTASDVESGIARVNFPGLAGGMTPTGATDDTTSPYSQTYSWSFGATESGAKTVTAFDHAGNSSTGNFTIVRDAAGPTGHSVTLSGGPVFTTPSVPLVLSSGTDGAGSGIDPTFNSLGRDSAPLVGGGCGSFSGTWFGISLTGGADTGVTPGNCYRYRYMVRDNVGNNSAWSTPSADAVVVNSGVGFHSASSGGTVGTSLTLNKPAGTVVNDLLLAQVTVRSTSIVITPSAGWTFVRRDNTGSGSNQLGQAVYYKFAGPSEPASYVWSLSGSIDVSGGIVAEAGVSPTSPIDVSGGLGGSGTSVTAPSVTTTALDAGLVAFFGSGSSTAFTPPAGMTERYQAGGGQTAVSAADGNQGAAGATGARTATAPSAPSSAPNIGQLIALRKDATPPTAPILALSESAPDAFASGTTLFYRPAGSGSFTLSASATDSESGLQAIVLPGLSAGFTPATDASATSRAYNWTSGATDSGSKTVTAYDNAGNTATSTFTLTADSAPPSGGSVSYPDGDDADGVVTIATSDGTDAGAGVDASSGTIEQQTAPLSGGVCGAFDSWAAVTSPDTLSAATCAQYRYRVLDRVGNEVIYTSANIVRFAGSDLTPPSAPALTLSESEPDEHVSGTTLFYNPSGDNTGSFGVEASTADAESGIARVDFPAIFALDSSSDTTSPYQATYTWTSAATATGTVTVAAVNGVDLTTGSVFSLVRDTDAPTGGSVSYVDGYDDDGSIVLVTSDGSDAGAGIEASSGLIERQTATLSGGSCGSFGAWSPVVSPDPLPTASCARYRYRLADRVGNEAVYTSTAVVRTDVSPPSAPALTITESEADEHFAGSTLYYNPSGSNAGTFTVEAASSDAESAVSALAFPIVFGADSATDAVAPYSHSYSWTSAASADTDVTVTVENGAGLAATSSFTVTPDTAGPDVSLLAPADAAAVRNGQTLATAALDALAGTAAVEFRYCSGAPCNWSTGTPLGTDSAAPFELAWTAQPPDGAYTVLARAVDNVGNATEASPVTVLVDNTAPVVAQNNPGTPLEGDVVVEATTSDVTSGVTAAEFQVSPGGQDTWTTIETDSTTPYSIVWDTLTVNDGRYDLRVIATDRAGNSAISGVVRNRQVTNHPPVVSITSPDGFYVTGSDADPFLLEATSPSPQLRHVEFFSCSDASVSCSTGTWVPLGLDEEAPYTATWPVDPDGNRALKAVVTNLAWSTGTDVNNIRIDRTGPTGGSITYADGYDADGSVALATVNGSDGGSGVDTSSGVTERQTAPLADGACGSFGPWTGAPANPDTVPHATCARYRYHVLDEAGNRATYSSAATVMVDFTAPPAPTLSLAENTGDQHVEGGTIFYNPSAPNSGSFTVSASATDPESGIEAVEFPLVYGTDDHSDAAQPFEREYSWTSSSAAAGEFEVTARNAAGLTAEASFFLALDAGAPSVSISTPAASASIRVGQALAATAADALSGPREVEFRYCPGPACEWALATPIATDPSAPYEVNWTGQPADGAYTLLARSVDNVGNESTVETRTITIDNTAPAVGFSEPGAYVNGSGPNPVVVTATSPDSVAAIEILRCDDASSDCATGTWVSLGSSALAPFSVSSSEPDGNRAFRVVAHDETGNSSSAVHNVIVDRTPPVGPVLTSSHTAGSSSTDNTVDMTFASAGDGLSGLDGFSYHWDTDAASAADTLLDADETAAGATSPTLGDGTWYFHVRAADRAGNWSDTVHAGPFVIDTTAPSSASSIPSVGTVKAIQLTKTFVLSWSAAGAVAYDVRYRTAGTNGSFGTHASWLAGTSALNDVFNGSPGSTHCLSARGIDADGLPSDWSSEACTTVPLNNTSLTHKGSWVKKKGSGYYLGSYSLSSQRGASLTRTGVGARRIALIATKCPACGTVGVYWNKTLLKKVSLASPATRKKQLIQLPLFGSLRQGTVKLVVLSSGRPVRIEGLATSPL